MFDTQLINAVLQWERRLEIENAKRKNDLDDLPINSQPRREEHTSIFARIFGLGKNRQPENCCYISEPCQEGQLS